MPKISACFYYSSNKLILAICHNTPANMIKVKICSTDLHGINRNNIHVIQDNVESAEPPQQIISRCLQEAISADKRLEADASSLFEIVYFGDVNLTEPGKKIYPSFLMDKKAFSTFIKAYFPNCIFIKRIFVSADHDLIAAAKTEFHKDEENHNFPLFVDSFVDKNYRDLYTEIHRINTELIDAVLKYHRTFPTVASEKSDNLDDLSSEESVNLDDFSSIECCIGEIEDKLEYLLCPEGHPLTFHSISHLQQDFHQQSNDYAELTLENLSSHKSTLVSLVFSHLIPRSLGDKIKGLLSVEGFEILHDSVMHTGEMKHHELGKMLNTLVEEQRNYFKLYFQNSKQLTKIARDLSEKMHDYKSKSEHYAYFTPSIATAVDEVNYNLELLLILLEEKSQELQEIERELENLSLKVNNFTHEASIKKVLSNLSFFPENFSYDTNVSKKTATSDHGISHEVQVTPVVKKFLS